MMPCFPGVRLLSPCAVVGVAFVMAGCSARDRAATTEFTPNPADGTFEFRAGADTIRPLNSPGAEGERLEWLAYYMEETELCPNGYEITERVPVLVYSGIGDIHDIIYRGRCLS